MKQMISSKLSKVGYMVKQIEGDRRLMTLICSKSIESPAESLVGDDGKARLYSR